ncbi:hypothetical protein M9H77_35847 [Catharanthus roseus]|uniref:Uncharacterized protein n=1 Tax=Catharanthus roseus TaxID=4058 RepID=A0ACB9ZSC4_CATRO|nr:hypothetical protein M9H77_35847 [Catharanthus roseus]
MTKNPRALREYFTPNTYNSPIGNRLPKIEANHFKIKASTIQMLPSFYGLDSENPYKHIDEFLEIRSTFKLPSVTYDAIRLRLFPFSLKDKAEHWLHTRDRVGSWAEMSNKFLKKYFPMGKLTGLIMSKDGHILTQSHQEGPSDSSRMNLNETLRSIDVEELKKGKSSAIMEQRVGDNLDYGDNPNIGQAYHGGCYDNQQGNKPLDKIKWKMPSFKSESDPNSKDREFEAQGKHHKLFTKYSIDEKQSRN